METKNFELFLKENYTELAASSEEISENPEAPVGDSEIIDGEVDATASTDASTVADAPLSPAPAETTVPGMDSVGPKSGKALYIYGGVDSLNNQDSALLQAMNQLTTSLDCCEADVVKLYQLNIQPVSSDSNVAEPADGMSFIYEKLNDADVVVFVSPVQDGDVSSLTQTLLKRLASHYKNMELKNKIYAALLMGDQHSQQSVKADLSNQANNLGLIIGAGTTIFDVSQIQTLVQAVKEVKEATANIRSAAPINTTVPGVMNFDQFATSQATATTDLALPAKVETDAEKADSFEVVSDTNTDEVSGEEETSAPEEGGESTESETSEEGVDKVENSEESTETESEEGTEEGGEELTEEEELSRKQRKLPTHLLKAILKSKKFEEEEEIERTEAPTFESKNENVSMKKVHHIARFSEMKTDKTKNQFIANVDNKKMSTSTINPAPSVKKEVAPDQKVEKGGTTVPAEIQPNPDSSKMSTAAASPTAGAKNLGTEENGEVKTAKAVKKNTIENFSSFATKK